MRTDIFRRTLAPMLVVAGILLLPGRAYAAGGAFVVDDSEIGKPGECKVESWASAAANHDFSAVTSPACVVKLGIPVELGGQLQRSRSDGAWSDSGTIRAKTNIIPVDKHLFGLGISGGTTWDFKSGGNTTSFVNVPVTFQLQEKFRLNVNGGWMYDNVANVNYLTWGAGFEWNFVKPVSLIGEVYGQSGSRPAGTSGTIVEPRAQLGVRYMPRDNVDIDLIWGHNITGENSNWVTLGVNWRF